MSVWIETTLSEISEEIIYGYTASASTKQIGPKFLRITDIVPDRINWDTVPYCDADKKAIEKYKLFDGDIIIARTGATTGYNKIIKNIPHEAIFASYLIRFRINKNKALPDYLGHILTSKDWNSYIKAISGGSAQPGANAKLLGSYPIMLPPLSEQKAIAGVLSSLYDKIDLLHRQNKTLEAMAETLFRQWFIEEAEDDWEEVKLSDIAVIKIGRTPPRKEKEWFSNNSDDIKWISIKDLGERGVYIFNTAERLTREAVEKHSIPKIPKNSVVLSFKMTVGRVSITSEEMLSNEAIAQFQLKRNTGITTEFLYLFLKQYKYNSLGSTSSIVTAINSAMIRDIAITIPNLIQISNSNQIFTSIFKKMRKNQIQIDHLQVFRDVLLPKLISGEKKVSPGD